MVYGALPICVDCRHLNADDLDENTCTAFPQRIPDEIFVDGFDHREPFPGDNGIRFEPREGADVT